MDNKTFDFSTALTLLKEGRRLSRKQFGGTCYIKMVRFENDGFSTVVRLDYIEMIKQVKVFADDNEGNKVLCSFPFTPSSESILADDWYEVEGMFFID